jgi:hypothetical protein
LAKNLLYILVVGSRILQEEEEIMPTKKPSKRTKKLARAKRLEAKKPLLRMAQ